MYIYVTYFSKRITQHAPGPLEIRVVPVHARASPAMQILSTFSTASIRFLFSALSFKLYDRTYDYFIFIMIPSGLRSPSNPRSCCSYPDSVRSYQPRRIKPAQVSFISCYSSPYDSSSGSPLHKPHPSAPALFDGETCSPGSVAIHIHAYTTCIY